MPPLRARPEDIPVLIEHFIADLNKGYGLAVRGATREALRLLAQHPWRGNVRELEAALEQAVIFRSGDWITAEDLDLQTRPDRDVIDGTAGAGRQSVITTAALSWLQHEALRIVAERREIRRREFIARYRISRGVAGRELAGLVRLGLCR